MEGTAETSIPVILRSFYAITPPRHERGLLSVNSCMQELFILMRDRIYKDSLSIVNLIQMPVVTFLTLPPHLSIPIQRSASERTAPGSSLSSIGSGPMVREHTAPFHESDSEEDSPLTVLDTQQPCHRLNDIDPKDAIVNILPVFQQNTNNSEQSGVLSPEGLSVSRPTSAILEEIGFVLGQPLPLPHILPWNQLSSIGGEEDEEA